MSTARLKQSLIEESSLVGPNSRQTLFTPPTTIAMSGSSKPESGRIAIKFGAPATSASSAGKSSRPLPSSSLGKRPRPGHGLGGHFDSESEDESHTNGRHERITAFGDKGAEDRKSVV